MKKNLLAGLSALYALILICSTASAQTAVRAAATSMYAGIYVVSILFVVVLVASIASAKADVVIAVISKVLFTVYLVAWHVLTVVLFYGRNGVIGCIAAALLPPFAEIYGLILNFAGSGTFSGYWWYLVFAAIIFVAVLLYVGGSTTTGWKRFLCAVGASLLLAVFVAIVYYEAWFLWLILSGAGEAAGIIGYW